MVDTSNPFIARWIPTADESMMILWAGLAFCRMPQSRPVANARSIRNALDRARLRQASRILAMGTISREDVSSIVSADISGSRVLAADPAANVSAVPDTPAGPGRTASLSP